MSSSSEHSPDARPGHPCGSGEGQLQRFMCQWRFLWTVAPCSKVGEIVTKIKFTHRNSKMIMKFLWYELIIQKDPFFPLLFINTIPQDVFVLNKGVSAQELYLIILVSPFQIMIFYGSMKYLMRLAKPRQALHHTETFPRSECIGQLSIEDVYEIPYSVSPTLCFYGTAYYTAIQSALYRLCNQILIITLTTE